MHKHRQSQTNTFLVHPIYYIIVLVTCQQTHIRNLCNPVNFHMSECFMCTFSSNCTLITCSFYPLMVIWFCPRLDIFSPFFMRSTTQFPSVAEFPINFSAISIRATWLRERCKVFIQHILYRIYH